MKNIKIFLLFFSIFCFSQNTSHIISGLDLNEDWYTLTNQGQLGYVIQESYREENNLPGVAMEIYEKYLESNVDKDFLDIDFSDLTLIFPAKNQTNLNTLKPTIFLANKMYDSEAEYLSRSQKDFNKIVYILMNQFGSPSSTAKESWGSAFEWNSNNAQLMLLKNKTQHIVLTYIKNNK
tara:strand:+ start:281 stop:817 length:537 start_codon:yes stop_codon:yes gene_type:complete